MLYRSHLYYDIKKIPLQYTLELICNKNKLLYFYRFRGGHHPFSVNESWRFFPWSFVNFSLTRARPGAGRALWLTKIRLFPEATEKVPRKTDDFPFK